ncbi:MAG: hypothetical protein PHP62_02775 [Candidatus Moranbacteria bacterium]|nr:hypothetical protein [Candidatus Moranbacteria bacterium]
MNKKIFNAVAVGVVAFFCFANVSRADIAPSQPNCPAEWSSNPYNSSGICNIINKKVSISSTEKFDANFVYVLEEDDSAYCKNKTFSIIPSSSEVSEPDKKSYKRWAVKKDFLEKNGGLEGIFRTSIVKDATGEFCKTNTLMNPRNQKAFDENFYNVTIDLENRDDLAWWGNNANISNDNGDKIFPTGIYPYLVVPANSPVTEKEFVYTPSRLYCLSYEKKCNLVLYKSKEIWTLDNGEKKEYLFWDSSINTDNTASSLGDDTFQNKASVQMYAGQNSTDSDAIMVAEDKQKQDCPNIEKPIEKGFWAKIACFFEGIIGKKC